MARGVFSLSAHTKHQAPSTRESPIFKTPICLRRHRPDSNYGATNWNLVLGISLVLGACGLELLNPLYGFGRFITTMVNTPWAFRVVVATFTNVQPCRDSRLS